MRSVLNKPTPEEFDPELKQEEALEEAAPVAPDTPAPDGLEAEEIVAYLESLHLGPLPSANEMLGYEQALPGLANRIMEMAEAQQRMAERQQCQDNGVRTRVIEHNQRLETRGQLCGFAMAVYFVVAGTYFLASDAALSQTTLVLSPGVIWFLASLIHSLIRGRSTR